MTRAARVCRRQSTLSRPAIRPIPFARVLGNSHPLMSFTQFFVASLLSVIVYRLLQIRERPRLPFPPGPAGMRLGLWLIGNLGDLPTQYPWLKYEKMGQDLGKYLQGGPLSVAETHRRCLGSDILHLEFFGTHLVVLNSEKAATDLLEKRSSIYSDRCVQKISLHNPILTSNRLQGLN